MKLKNKHNQGFALAELLVATMILGFTVAIGYSLIDYSFNSYNFGYAQTNAQQDARFAMERIIQEVRKAKTIKIVTEMSEIDKYHHIKVDKDTNPNEPKLQIYKPNIPEPEELPLGKGIPTNSNKEALPIISFCRYSKKNDKSTLGIRIYVYSQALSRDPDPDPEPDPYGDDDLDPGVGNYYRVQTAILLNNTTLPTGLGSGPGHIIQYTK
ncbi:PilW family protein [Heliophilum fasciatum]|uniref:Prepilin-type N-terminal cleavage/methylation domain-containing protein n=1 Tax=Heliophilum fasciatum TaxID=35700 RepID=A0A4R2RWI1_9FIRM|nr:prepilin-type N-terminal cleavage/methylation domain-containing protein [Heliophilum fasciatum]MCW2277269.1 prepilin-type N-terminal cleavage/methylation domain-containing protein [Heliophilum fasciatum]TCP67107.1 prepilin-type N-terminal cleavage/methylation domain-containing protein [Heliophilum fasciatum]